MSAPRYHGPLARRFRALRTPRPDPWPAEISAAVNAKSAVPLCPNCLLPQEPHPWFCRQCGFPTGDFVALNPYLNIFVVGEVLRRGVLGAPERRLGTQLFLIVFSASQHAVFAPAYWFWMWRRSCGRPIGEERRDVFAIDEKTS